MKDWIKSFASVSDQGNDKVSLAKLISFRKWDINKGYAFLLVKNKITNCKDLRRIHIQNILWDKILLSEKTKKSH